ncbi:hypothetical protein G6F36_012419 [Rhizopus arrhizus]|nr:hypothetical protein G6F36_012419 [Rhizopus arrhizus]
MFFWTRSVDPIAHTSHVFNYETISVTNRSYPAIDHVLKDSIIFENGVIKLLPCRILDPTVPLVRLLLSNRPFFKEDILKEQLKVSLEPYGYVLTWEYYDNH